MLSIKIHWVRTNENKLSEEEEEGEETEVVLNKKKLKRFNRERTKYCCSERIFDQRTIDEEKSKLCLCAFELENYWKLRRRRRKEKRSPRSCCCQSRALFVLFLFVKTFLVVENWIEARGQQRKKRWIRAKKKKPEREPWFICVRARVWSISPAIEILFVNVIFVTCWNWLKNGLISDSVIWIVTRC